MSQMEKYNNDPRTPCRYGEKCYQKNLEHLSKFKHPPKKSKRKYNAKTTPAKRPKLNEETQKELSDSEEKDSNIENQRKRECISSSDSEQNDENEEKRNATQKEQPDSAKNDFNDEKHEQNKSDDSEQNDEKSSKVQTEECSTESATKPANSNKPFNPKSFIKSRFLVEPPPDFYDFWEFCKELKPSAPSDAFKVVGLELVGAYDVLAGKFKNVKKSPEEYLRHWRFYYDPPEVFTVIKGDKTGYHIGYFYDSPEEAPSFLVSNHGTVDGVFTKMGDNIFTAVNIYLEELKKIGDPFKKMHVGKLQSLIKKKSEELQLNLSVHSKKIREREFKVVAKTFNKIGLVVPYNKKTQLGYRDLAMVDKDLMTLLTKLQKAAPEQRSKYLSDLQPVLTYASIALDECDFGTGVKLGWQLLYHGIDTLDSTIAQFLGNSYRLLNKEAFAKIAEAHMKNRKKSSHLSII